MGFALSPMRLDSDAFHAGGAIPQRYTGEGEDISPALSWTDVPKGTEAFAIVCHDPDAPLISDGHYGFVHWVLYDIPGSTRALSEGCEDFSQGRNDFGQAGYGGPMPPPGHGPHRYYFWLLALDEAVELPGRLGMWELLEKIEPHVIGMNRLVGTYQRG